MDGQVVSSQGQKAALRLMVLNLETTDAGEDVEKKEHFYSVGGSVN